MPGVVCQTSAQVWTFQPQNNKSSEVKAFYFLSPSPNQKGRSLSPKLRFRVKKFKAGKVRTCRDSRLHSRLDSEGKPGEPKSQGVEASEWAMTQPYSQGSQGYGHLLCQRRNHKLDEAHLNMKHHMRQQ